MCEPVCSVHSTTALPTNEASPPTHRPPGIAWDPEGRRLFVTGKWWPRLFEVAPRAINPHKKENRQRAQACIV